MLNACVAAAEPGRSAGWLRKEGAGFGVYYCWRRTGEEGEGVSECQESRASLGLIGSSSRALTAVNQAHVHVERESSTCKFWLEPIELARSHGFSAHELGVIRRTIRAQRNEILERWHEHCG